jgi:hypothetical protein
MAHKRGDRMLVLLLLLAWMVLLVAGFSPFRLGGMLLTLALALNFIAVEQERGAPSEGFAAALNRNR